MAQLIAVAARTIVPSRMLRLLPRTPVCPTHVLGQPVVCVLCVCHLRIFFSPTVTLSLHCRYTTGVTSVTMIRAKLIETEPVHFATAESTPVSCACINSLVFSLRFTRLKGFGEQTQRDCRRVRSRWHTSAVTQPRTKILAASRDILSLRLCVCVCVYRANHCPSASADPPARVSRARSKLSLDQAGQAGLHAARISTARWCSSGGKNPFFTPSELANQRRQSGAKNGFGGYRTAAASSASPLVSSG